jgi:hypothetical protein
MLIQLMDVIRPLAALLSGGVIGLGFGWVQNLALQRNEKRQQSGGLNSGWLVMPGSMSRVAYLLLALVLVQILCPLLFVHGSQWWVSAGVVAAYGALLFRRLGQHDGHQA